MTEITPSTSNIAKAAPSVRAPGHTVSGVFASALALLLPGQGEVDAVEGKPGDPRQALAGSGKDLPLAGKPADGSDLLWLPFGLQRPQTPVATPIMPPQTRAAAPIEGEGELQPIVLPAAVPAGIADKLVKAASDKLAAAGQQPQPGVDAQPAKFELPADIAAPGGRTAAAPAPALQLQPQAAPTIVAQALVVAQPLETGATLRRAQHDGDALTVTAPATEAVRPTAVAASGDAQQGTLDMRNDKWMGSMIDHIAALRDMADANDTRIRLVPDALGTIDVSIRKDADRVHVHFAAEAQATRALLSDAAPKLAELADARGLRLGDTSVGTGSEQARGGRQDAPRAPLRTAPASAVTESETITDTRIA